MQSGSIFTFRNDSNHTFVFLSTVLRYKILIVGLNGLTLTLLVVTLIVILFRVIVNTSGVFLANWPAFWTACKSQLTCFFFHLTTLNSIIVFFLKQLILYWCLSDADLHSETLYTILSHSHPQHNMNVQNMYCWWTFK